MAVAAASEESIMKEEVAADSKGFTMIGFGWDARGSRGVYRKDDEKIWCKELEIFGNLKYEIYLL